MLRWVVLAVVVLLVLGTAATMAIEGVSGNDRPDSGGELTMDELEERVADTWRLDLRDMQRKRELDGELWVAGVDCASRPNSHFVCLAHVAATGEARRLARRPIVITGRLGAGGGWVARERR